jgi:beta-lactamase superfamily II metal-dependent hydrolase
MNSSPEMYILDVGHGSCAILKDTDGVIIFDCAPGSTLLDALLQLGISEVDAILLSHADSDHIGGVVNLLTEPSIHIHNIFVNPDSTKNSHIWKDFRIAAKDAQKRGTKVTTSLTSSLGNTISAGQVTVEVLAPNASIILSGAGGSDLRENRLDSNSVSAVVRLTHNDHPVILLPGDIDIVGLKNLLEDFPRIHADIAVFPHHGGRPGSSSPQEFSELFCSSVQPNLIVFSIDRTKHLNPHRDILIGVRRSVPKAHIMCTQLSKQCIVSLDRINQNHLYPIPSKGKTSNQCCGGSIVIKFDGINSAYTPNNSHKDFIHAIAGSNGMPLCLL